MGQTFVIIDDHPLYRTGIRALVQEKLNLECIGEASTIEEACALLNHTQPNLAIIDISLQDEDGLNLVSQCRQDHSTVKILVVSMHDEALYGERALKAGAHGYVMKHERSEALLTAIERILVGQLGISAELKDLIAQRLVTQTKEDRLATLTEREIEILTLVGKGFGGVEIAQHLSISAKTVYSHQDHIKQKMEFESISELRKFAINWYVNRR